MAKQKTVSRQVKIGEAGIALIERRALEMGHVFHPRRVDYGIDGHLDLVEPGTGVALNLAMLVQSKASDSRFADEDDDGFHYLCDSRDLDTWLAGNAPVLLVFSHLVAAVRTARSGSKRPSGDGDPCGRRVC